MERTLPATTWRLSLPSWRRMAFLSVVGVLAVVFVLRVYLLFVNIDGADFDIYRRAASSWATTGDPYLYAGTNGLGSYRYAPWWAALWIPFASLPREPVLVVWVIVLLAATVLVMAAVVHEHGERGIPIALLGGGLLVSTTGGSNLQPLLVAMLYLALHRRAGPLCVGIAASVKIFPILYVIPWIGRGEWRKAAVAVGVMAALYAPILLYHVPPAAFDPGAEYWPSPLLWLACGGGAVVAAFIYARTRYAWIAAGAATVLCIPRMLDLDLSMILPAAARER